MRQRLTDIFRTTDDQLPAQYATLATVLADADKPRSLLNWLRESPSFRLLQSIAVGNATLTHQHLDQLRPSPALHYLRRLLVFAAVLPPRQLEHLDRLTPWLRDQLRERPAQQVRTMHAYAEWDVLHRARRRANRNGRFTTGSASAARHRITTALDLMAWLDNRQLRLDQLNQPLLDQWLTDQPNHRRQPARNFLRWAGQRGMARQLTVPTINASSPRPILTDEQRWQQLRRCIHDDTIPIAIRAVGALTLLFGLHTSRILQLTTDDIRTTTNTTTVKIGAHPIELPPRIASVLVRQRDHARGIHDTAAPETAAWMFPGARGIQPSHPSHICDLLARHGIDANAGRHAALIDLAADLPAPVLASLIGVDMTTAVHWSRRAQRDWSIYLSARTEQIGNCR